MKFLLSAIFLSISIFSYSQNFKVSGTLVDADDKKPIEAATVFMETELDSTLITYTITDRSGRFTLEGKTGAKKVKVNISFVGYESVQKNIDLTESVQDLRTIPMDISIASLSEVVVKSRAPITIKKDTLEFNVASFKTKKDATIEDLLKELPGVEVDPDGKIKVNGKDVSNVLVNGKPFFGNDPTIATRNLTKELIEKVQVVDTKTKAEAFTGEEGDKESKTINLTIKEENNKGIFGRVAAGGGTDKRFEYAGLFNYFDNDRRISVLAGGNNINSPGFSFGEIQKMFGSPSNMSMSSSGAFSMDGRSFGYGEGIVNSRIAGANYADVIGKSVDVTADYFYSGSIANSDSKIQRENILPDRRYYTNSKSNSENETDSHAVNLGFDIKVDSTFLINIKPSFAYSELKGIRNSSSTSLNESRIITNNSDFEGFDDTQNRNFKNDLDITKKYGSKGGFVRVRLSNEVGDTNGHSFLYSETNIFGENPSQEIRDQQNLLDRNRADYSGRLTYRAPLLAEKLFLDLQYSQRYKKILNSKSVFDYNAATQSYNGFNTDLSTEYNFRDIQNTPSASLVYKLKDITLDVGAGYVFRNLKGSDGLRPKVKVDSNYDALELNARGSFKFSASKRLYVGYSLQNQAPQIEQLLPNKDITNPLNTVSGNPDLKPIDQHSFYFNYNNYDYQKNSGYYAYLNGNINENAVVTKSIVDENNLRQTTYVNVNGNYSLWGSLSLYREYKLDTLLKLTPRIGFYARYFEDVNFNNGVEYKSFNSSITPNLGMTLNWLKILNIRVSYSIGYRRNSYDKNIFEDRNFSSQILSLGTTLYVPKNFEWRNDIKYTNNPDIQAGFQRSSWFWNTTVSYSFLKERGMLSLKIYDLLNQNSNAQRTSSENFVQDSESTVLQRYLMLGFSYKFNTLGSKGETRIGDIYFD